MATSRSNREGGFQDSVLEYLNDRGGYWIKLSASSFQKSGEPDIIGCYKGKFYAFELKKERVSKISKLQIFKLNKIEKNGGVSMKIFNLNQLKELLDSGE